MSAAPVMVSIGDAGVLNRELPQPLSDVWLDRDLGWLDFNGRVLAEALDERTPLPERVKFLAIFTSNLDEFFMKRVAFLRSGSRPERVKLLTQVRERLMTSRATAVKPGFLGSTRKACLTAVLGRSYFRSDVRALTSNYTAIAQGQYMWERTGINSTSWCSLLGPAVRVGRNQGLGGAPQSGGARLAPRPCPSEP
jgi:hypothetical protein